MCSLQPGVCTHPKIMKSLYHHSVNVKGLHGLFQFNNTNSMKSLCFNSPADWITSFPDQQENFYWFALFCLNCFLLNGIILWCQDPGVKVTYHVRIHLNFTLKQGSTKKNKITSLYMIGAMCFQFKGPVCRLSSHKKPLLPSHVCINTGRKPFRSIWNITVN